MDIAVITVLPDLFTAFTKLGVVGRAFERKRANIRFFNPRDFTHDNYHRIDERPYGGGPGMVMMAEPLYQAIRAAKTQLGEDTPVHLLSPQGSVFTQQQAKVLSQQTKMIFICGRYEGIDQRLIDECVDAEISIGQYVVSGGEVPAMVVIDAIIRLLPGVLNDPESAIQESFSNDNEFDYPVYTTPRIWRDQVVPEVLLSGDHKKINTWRQSQAKAKEGKQ